jgi:hypothetical protein
MMRPYLSSRRRGAGVRFLLSDGFGMTRAERGGFIES